MRFPHSALTRVGLSAVSGVALFLSLPKSGLSVLVWVAVVPLLVVVVTEPNPRRAFLWGYIGGVVFFAGSCYWFASVVENYGGLSRLSALAALLLFALVFAIYFGIFGFVLAWLGKHSQVLALASAPVIWVALEYARTYIISGFPWNLAGYAVTPLGLRQLATLTGVYGLSFLAVATGAWVAASGLLKPSRSVKWMAIGWLCVLYAANRLLLPPPFEQDPRSETVYLIQPDVPLSGSSSPGGATETAAWREMFTAGLRRVGEAGHPRPPLLIWPESSAPLYFNRDSAFRNFAENSARSAGAFLVLGVVNFTEGNEPKPLNSAVMIGPDGRLLLEYDKIHLVPFGEYVPSWGFPNQVGKITSEVGDFQPGNGFEVGQTDRGKVGIFICYEAIFPDLVRRFARAGAEVLVNISNDAWFGESSAAEQHLAMARIRAVENRRYLLRATNNGISAVIDPYGRILRRGPRFERSILSGTFEYRKDTTFYTEQGDIFAWVCCLGSLLALGFRFTRARRSATQARKE